jgi:hypothetical protein
MKLPQVKKMCNVIPNYYTFIVNFVDNTIATDLMNSNDNMNVVDLTGLNLPDTERASNYKSCTSKSLALAFSY